MKSRVLILSLVLVMILALSLSACTGQVTVTFDTNGGSAISAVKGNPGAELGVDEPTLDGKKFGGWYKDAEFTEEFTTKAFPVEDITLYAKWVEQTYNVTFIVEGTSSTTVTVNAGDKVTIPNVVLPDGMRVAAWLDGTTEFNTNTVVSEDLTLTARLVEADKALVKLDINGVIFTELVVKGSTFAKPEDPSIANYDFVTWNKGTSEYNFNDVVNGDLTLTAKFTPSVITVAFRVFNPETSQLIEEREVETTYGNTVIIPNANSFELPEGQMITGWEKDGVAFDKDSVVTINKDGKIIVNAVVEYETCVVTYIDYNGDVLDTDSREYGSTVSKPTTITVTVPDYHEFTGNWMIKDSDTNFAFDEDMLTASIILEPVVTKATVEVKYGYILNGEDEVTYIDDLTTTVAYGETLTAPTFNAVANNTFVAWVDEDGDTFDFTAKVDKDVISGTAGEYTLTIYAELDADDITIDFTYGTTGDKTATVDAKWGDTLADVLASVDGYVVDEYTIVSYKDGETTFTTDSNLYADADITIEYEATLYSVTFVDEFADAEVVHEDLAPNAEVAVPATNEDSLLYTFEGWFVADEDGNATDVEATIANDKLTADNNYVIVAVYAKITEAATAEQLQAIVTSGGEVHLTADIDCDLVVTAIPGLPADAVGVVLYLDGYKLTSVNGNTITVKTSASITIIDEVGGGVVECNVAKHSALFVEQGAYCGVFNGDFLSTAPVGQIAGNTVVNHGETVLGYTQEIYPTIVNSSMFGYAVVNGNDDNAGGEISDLTINCAIISGGKTALLNGKFGELTVYYASIYAGSESALVNINVVNVLMYLDVYGEGDYAMVNAGNGEEGSMGELNLVYTEGSQQASMGVLILNGADSKLATIYELDGVVYGESTINNNGKIAIENGDTVLGLLNSGVIGEFILLSDLNGNLVFNELEDQNAYVAIFLNGYNINAKDGVAITNNGVLILIGDKDKSSVNACDGYAAIVNNGIVNAVQGLKINGAEDASTVINTYRFIIGNTSEGVQMFDNYTYINGGNDEYPTIVNGYSADAVPAGTVEDYSAAFIVQLDTCLVITGGSEGIFNGAYGYLAMYWGEISGAKTAAIHNLGEVEIVPTILRMSLESGEGTLLFNETVNEHTAGIVTFYSDLVLLNGYTLGQKYADGFNTEEVGFFLGDDEIKVYVEDRTYMKAIKVIFGDTNVFQYEVADPSKQEYTVYVENKFSSDILKLISKNGLIDPEYLSDDSAEYVVVNGNVAPADHADPELGECVRFLGYVQLLGWTLDEETGYCTLNYGDEFIFGTTEVTNNMVVIPRFEYVASNAEELAGLIDAGAAEITLTADITIDLVVEAQLTLNLNGYTLIANNTNAITNANYLYIYNGTVEAVGGSAVTNYGYFTATDVTFIGGGLYTPTIVNYSNMQLGGMDAEDAVTIQTTGNNVAIENGSRAMGEYECQLYLINAIVENTVDGYTDFLINNLFGGMLLLDGGNVGNGNEGAGIYNLAEVYFIGAPTAFENDLDDIYNLGGIMTMYNEEYGFFGSINLTEDVVINNASEESVFVNANIILIDSVESFNYALSLGIEGYFMLAGNITGDLVIPEDKSIVIDLNGYTLSAKASHAITNNGSLTVLDSSEEGTGTVDGTVDGKAAIYTSATGATTIRSGNFTRSLEDGNGDNKTNSFCTVLNHGTTVVYDGTFTNNGTFSSLLSNGWSEGADINVEAAMIIAGGTFTGGKATIKNDEMGMLTINGGNFSGADQYTLVNVGKVVINGGNFTMSTDGKLFLNGSYNATSAGIFAINGSISVEADVIFDFYPDGEFVSALYINGTLTVKTTQDEADKITDAMEEESIGEVVVDVVAELLD